MKTIDQKVFDLLKTLLGITFINKSDSPETIPQWDSFNQIVILEEISREFDITIGDDVFMNFYTVKDLIELVKNNQT